MRLMPKFKRNAKGTPRRPNPANRRRRMAIRAGIAACGVAGMAGGGWYLSHTGWIAKQTETAMTAAIEASARAGLRVEDVVLSGRQNADAADILAALDLERGAPILDIDMAGARERLVSLGWVASAEIARRLPDIVYVHIVEREPLALWQHDGKSALIDRAGVTIQRSRLDRFAHLPLVVGEGAPAHAADLIDLLRTYPAVAAATEAAIRVSDRRWNLRMRNGVDVRLPEIELTAALTRLDSFQRENALLERDVVAVDLRVPDRLIVRVAPGATPRPRGTEKDT
jgi:cell division protein FtsQ